jgi:predicted amidohydrolase
MATASGLEARPTGRHVDNLVRNAEFEEVGEDGVPLAWEVWAPREAIRPEVGVESGAGRDGTTAPKLSCRQRHDAGQIQQIVKPVSAGQAYGVSCWYRTRDVAAPEESVHVKLLWLGEDEKMVEKQFVPPISREGEWTRVAARLAAPEGAVAARLELSVAWAEGGSVYFDDAWMGEVAPVKHRRVRLATVCYVPRESSGPDENRRLFAEQAAAAGEQGADICCLPEGITLIGTGKSAADVAEAVPGPTTEAMGEVARKHGMYVVVGLYEWEGETLYNTAVLIDREGNIAGKYRKTHLPEAEVTWGITPGDTYPAFETDFGRIGIQICYDNFFPEVARSLALNGAEIVFLPIWGDGRDENRTWDVVARARAIDNSVYFVASNYSQKRSLIVDPWGQILADTAGEHGVVVQEVDLDERALQPWLSVGCNGEWERLWRNERRPSTYGPIVGGSGW